MNDRNAQLKQSIAKLLDDHVPLPARMRDAGIDWPVGIMDLQEISMRLGTEGEQVARREKDLYEQYALERRLYEFIGASIDDDGERKKLASFLLLVTGESQAEFLENAAMLQAILRQLGPHESQLLTPQETFRSLHIVALLRRDLESLDARLERMKSLALFGIAESVSLRGRQYLARVGRLYVSGFYPEAIIVGASAVEEELEQFLDGPGAEKRTATLGVLLGQAARRRLLSTGAYEAASRLRERRDHLLHVVMDAQISEREMQECLRDLGHVLTEICR